MAQPEGGLHHALREIGIVVILLAGDCEGESQSLAQPLCPVPRRPFLHLLLERFVTPGQIAVVVLAQIPTMVIGVAHKPTEIYFALTLRPSARIAVAAGSLAVTLPRRGRAGRIFHQVWTARWVDGKTESEAGRRKSIFELDRSPPCTMLALLCGRRHNAVAMGLINLTRCEPSGQLQVRSGI